MAFFLYHVLKHDAFPGASFLRRSQQEVMEQFTEDFANLEDDDDGE